MFHVKLSSMAIFQIKLIKVNSQLEVLGTDDAPIAGLYAIGLNAGGWIGNYYPGSGTALGGSSAQGRFIGKKLASN